MADTPDAAAQAAMARVRSGRYDHGRDCSLVGIEPARLADLETIADACEHYQRELERWRDLYGTDEPSDGVIGSAAGKIVAERNREIYSLKDQLAAALARERVLREFAEQVGLDLCYCAAIDEGPCHPCAARATLASPAAEPKP